MARARLLKPKFFTNEAIVELPFATRLLFAGLWCVADREGRMEDRPKRLKMELFPGDDIDIDGMLIELANAGLIVRYESDGTNYISIPGFVRNQKPHHREPPSTFPEPPGPAAESRGQPGPVREDAANSGLGDVNVPEEGEAAESRGQPRKAGASRAVTGVGNGSLAESESESESVTSGSTTTTARAHVFRIWEQATGTTITPAQGEQMISRVERHGIELVQEAIEHAAKDGKRSWNYVAAILDRCESQGLKPGEFTPSKPDDLPRGATKGGRYAKRTPSRSVADSWA